MRKKQTKIRRNAKAFTLSEVIIASLILIIAIVPILKALTSAHALDVKIEQRTRSLTLAEAKLEDITARSIYSWSTDFNASSISLEGSYLCDVADGVASDLRKIMILVGYDRDGDRTLDSDEVEVTLKTLLARRW